MPKKYKFSDIYKISSFEKGYKKMEKAMKELHATQKKLGVAGLKGQNKIIKNLSTQETAVKKLNAEQRQQRKQLNTINRENKKAIAIARKKANALNVELQTEKQLRLIKERHVTAQAKLNAAKIAGTKVTKSFSQQLKGGVQSLKDYAKGMLGITAAFLAFRKVKQTFQEFIDLAEAQILAEQKLTTVLKERTNATDKQVQSVLNLTKAQQELGVVGDEVQIAGAQQFATFVKSTKSVETLIPAMNNLLVQQKGLNASQGDAVNIANLVGRAFQGQLGSLTRVGISFSEAEGKILKYGTESERAAALAKIITNNVGEMNAAFAETDLGKIQQAENQIGDLKEQIGKGLIPVLRIFKQLSLEAFKNIRELGTDLLEPIKLIKELTAGLKISTDETERAELKWYDFILTFNLFRKRSKETIAVLKNLISPLRMLIKWNSILIKGLRKTLQFFGLLDSEAAIRAGNIREKVDELTTSFKALSTEQKKGVLKDFNKLNTQFKNGEIDAIAYAKALGLIILEAQTGGDDVIPTLTEGVKNLNEELDKLAGKTKGKGETSEGSELLQPFKYTNKDAAGALAEIDKVTSGIEQKSSGLNDYFNQLFHGDGPLLSRILGGGKDGAKRAKEIENVWRMTFSLMAQMADQELNRINALLQKQDEQIQKTEQQLNSELDRINQLKAAGQAFDVSEKQRLENKLKLEQKARERSLREEKLAKEKQTRLEKIQGGVNLAAAVLGALKTQPVWLGIALAAAVGILGGIQLSKIGDAKYATGTNYLELGGHPDGTDTIPILADKGERIVPRKDNAKIPRTFPNSMLPTAINYYLDSKSGTHIINSRDEKYLKEIAKNTRDNKEYRDGKLIKTVNGNFTYYRI